MGSANETVPAVATDYPRNSSQDARRADIRPYRASDYPELLTTYEAYGPSERTLGTPPDDRDRLVEWVDDVLETGQNWIANVADAVHGHVTVLPVTTERAELSVYVHPDHFGEGIGTALTSHAVDAAADSHTTIWLVVERSNVRAISVFENVGFETVATYRSEREMEYRRDEA